MKNKGIEIMIIFLVIASATIRLQAQGIRFENNKSWEQVLAQAKAEHRFIFVDCYATWCGPCKQMDKEVYINDTIGRFINTHFIAVKMQMDTAKSDNVVIKRHYADANQVGDKYRVGSYPTFLFFDPDGRLVHCEVGYQVPKRFLEIAMDALDPLKQFYPFFAAYEAGKENYTNMPNFIRVAYDLGQRELSLKMAVHYLHNYLDHLQEPIHPSKLQLDFVSRYRSLLTSNDLIFLWCIRRSQEADVLEQKDFAEELGAFVITKEIIKPEITKAKQGKLEPDWKMLKDTMCYKYDTTMVNRALIDAKVDWYKYAKDAQHYVKSLILKTGRMVNDNAFPKNSGGASDLNNCAWDIFLYSNENSELKTALGWIDWCIDIDAAHDLFWYDTKANILYKLDRKQEAIDLEKKAIELTPLAKRKSYGYLATLEKMKSGAATWKTNGMN